MPQNTSLCHLSWIIHVHIIVNCFYYFNLHVSVTPNIMSSNNKVVSLTPPDPSLTPANLLHVTRHIPLWGSEDSYCYLDMPESQHCEIVRLFHGEEAKQQLFTTWLASHPCPSWEQVRDLLRGGERFAGGVGGKEGRRAAREVEETYLKSELEILGQWSNTVNQEIHVAIKSCGNCSFIVNKKMCVLIYANSTKLVVMRAYTSIRYIKSIVIPLTEAYFSNLCTCFARRVNGCLPSTCRFGSLLLLEHLRQRKLASSVGFSPSSAPGITFPSQVKHRSGGAKQPRTLRACAVNASGKISYVLFHAFCRCLARITRIRFTHEFLDLRYLVIFCCILGFEISSS